MMLYVLSCSWYRIARNHFYRIPNMIFISCSCLAKYSHCIIHAILFMLFSHIRLISWHRWYVMYALITYTTCKWFVISWFSYYLLIMITTIPYLSYNRSVIYLILVILLYSSLSNTCYIPNLNFHIVIRISAWYLVYH